MHGQVFAVVILRINRVLLAEFGGKGDRHRTTGDSW